MPMLVVLNTDAADADDMALLYDACRTVTRSLRREAASWGYSSRPWRTSTDGRFAAIRAEDDEGTMLDEVWVEVIDNRKEFWRIYSAFSLFSSETRISEGESRTSDYLANAFDTWLESLASSDMATLIQQVRARTEALVRDLRLRILENERLLALLDERDAVIDQLEGQVRTLEAELRRKRFNPKRVRHAVTVISLVVSSAATVTMAAENARHPAAIVEQPSPEGDLLRRIDRDCRELNAHIEQHPAQKPDAIDGGSA